MCIYIYVYTYVYIYIYICRCVFAFNVFDCNPAAPAVLRGRINVLRRSPVINYKQNECIGNINNYEYIKRAIYKTNI